MRLNQRTQEYFEVGDDDDLAYEEKLARYEALTDAYFRAGRVRGFPPVALPDLDELTLDYVRAPRSTTSSSPRSGSRSSPNGRRR